MTLDEKIDALLHSGYPFSHYFVTIILNEVQEELKRLRDIEYRYESCSK